MVIEWCAGRERAGLAHLSRAANPAEVFIRPDVGATFTALVHGHLAPAVSLRVGPAVAAVAIVANQQFALLRNPKTQKRFTDYDFIAILQRMPIAGRQPAPTINKGSVRRSQVFD